MSVNAVLEKCKTSFDNSISSYLSCYLKTSFIVVFIMPRSSALGCAYGSGNNPSLSYP